MKPVENPARDFVAFSQSKADTNRLYSILLDARASSVSENMFDVSDKLVQSEKDNTKLALEQLWALKKNLQGQSGGGTVDLLIQYYQEKMDVLRNKEEHIKKISKDSRSLLEDKRKRDNEIATVKQEIADCNAALVELNSKMHRLTVKEQELTLIESQLKKELLANENEIVNGLYEIILVPQPENVNAENNAESAAPQKPQALFNEDVDDKLPATLDDQNLAKETRELEGNVEVLANAAAKSDDEKNEAKKLYLQTAAPDVPPFPKSVVKTIKGRVIGEYFYDAKAYKNKRHYILNGVFFINELRTSIQNLQKQFTDNAFTELIQMVQDTSKRTSENKNIHFEISTNEILNDKTLKEVWLNIKSRMYDEVIGFCRRFDAKIESLGRNYQVMLKEQISRYFES